jgi:ribosomal protein S18 acetylase RimI-like enzyme
MNFISNISPSDFQEVILLSDKLLGVGYLDEIQLQKYLDDSHKTGIVSKSPSGEITGFQLMLTCELDELLQMSVSEHNWFKEYFSNKSPIGVIKTVGVNPEYKNEGIGTLLTQKGIDILQKHAKSIISMCWDQKDDTPFARVLEKCNMHLIKTIPAYWEEDSLVKKYDCKICGEPPCLCAALIYEL